MLGIWFWVCWLILLLTGGFGIWTSGGGIIHVAGGILPLALFLFLGIKNFGNPLAGGPPSG